MAWHHHERRCQLELAIVQCYLRYGAARLRMCQLQPGIQPAPSHPPHLQHRRVAHASRLEHSAERSAQHVRRVLADAAQARARVGVA